MINRYLSTFCVIFLLCMTFVSAGDYADLEEYPNDFVLSIQKIEIPGHPNAFNPSIIRWNGRLLMSFREIVEPCTHSSASAGESIISLVWLDDDFLPISDTFILDFGTKQSRVEDPRLLKVGEDLYIVYSDNLDEFVTEGGFRMWRAKLDFDGEHFFLYEKERLSYFEGEQPWRREKNWVPFDYSGHLFFSYSISPHRVFHALEGTECCTTVATSDFRERWRWGELRGSTPAININERYLSFFHSVTDMATIHSEGKVVPHYFIGAYVFSKYHPFEVMYMSPRPIIAKGFYSGKSYAPYWKPTQVVFPCGILAEGNFIWITYGRQDHEIWVAKMDRVGLLRSLLPVIRILPCF